MILRPLIIHGVEEAGGRALPRWSPADAIALMNRFGIATGTLSVSTPGTTPAQNADEASAVARDVNDAVAAVAADRPDRFGLLATVPLPTSVPLRFSTATSVPGQAVEIGRSCAVEECPGFSRRGTRGVVGRGRCLRRLEIDRLVRTA